MKKSLMMLLPYLLALAADFYLLPLLIRDTGTAMLLLLCAIPAIAFFTGVVCGSRQGVSPLLPVAALLLFLPAIPLYYNFTAWVYAPVYGAIVLLGSFLGSLLHSRR